VLCLMLMKWQTAVDLCASAAAAIVVSVIYATRRWLRR